MTSQLTNCSPFVDFSSYFLSYLFSPGLLLIWSKYYNYIDYAFVNKEKISNKGFLYVMQKLRQESLCEQCEIKVERESLKSP
ncbi:hypothetical protein EUGRSUZ_G01549 [Eucalyptus grandis]|uniref:Uncharacterized protein n=2 Tax=Eucalyptus grandis TaxID=71139 RepID=A0A059BDY3_EUCGR|nr:hypothetical protein EUGRSUZ_G01549 [Eucalyptus grandis]